MSRPSLALACAGLLFYAVPAGSAEPRPRLFVLEAEPPGLAAVTLDTGESLGRLDLGRPPEGMVLSPDGSRLVVLDRGPGKGTFRFGYHPTRKSWATVVDTASFKEVAHTELCWIVDVRWAWGPDLAESGRKWRSPGWRSAFGGHAPAVFSADGHETIPDPLWGYPRREIEPGLTLRLQYSFSADGRRLTLPCLGYRSQKPEETLARELVNIDLSTGRVTGTIEIPREMDSLLALPGGDRAVVFSAREAHKNQSILPAELRFVNLAPLELQQTVTLDGEPGPPILSPAGEYLYLFESGKLEKNISGRVQVVSVVRRAHETNLEAGFPGRLVIDNESRQVFLLTAGTPSFLEKSVGLPVELRVIRGAALTATVRVGEVPFLSRSRGALPYQMRMDRDRHTLYVVSGRTVTAVDLPALSLTHSPVKVVELETGGGKKMVQEFEPSPNRKRAYVLYEGSSDLGVLDLEEHKFLAEVTTGRGRVKIGKTLAEGFGALAGGGYPPFALAGTNTSLVLSTDEKLAYVLNTRSNDVTIVDTEAREVVNHIGVGGSASWLELLPGGRFVAVTTGTDTLHLIDTRSNTKVSELPDVGNYVHSPDKRYAVVIGEGVIYCLDGASLKTLGRATGFRKPVQILFEPIPARRRLNGGLVQTYHHQLTAAGKRYGWSSADSVSPLRPPPAPRACPSTSSCSRRRPG